MNTAIIVAAGSGKRLASDTPKQFIVLAGKPVIIHTLERFEACAEIDQIVLVLPAENLADLRASVERFGISKLVSVVPGGASRAESVKCGLDAVDPATDVVAVHDGARPLVTPDEISRTVAAARNIGAACLAAAVTDTIKVVSGDMITSTVDRTKLRRALTPQAFRYDILRRALSENMLDDSVTDECSLVEKLGIEIAAVAGSPRNIKITHREDLVLAEAFLNEVK